MKKIILFLLFLICGSMLISCKTETSKELLSIEAIVPEGLTVYQGDTYIPRNIKINAIYEDETRDVTSYAIFSKIETYEIGFQTVIVTYQDKETSYQVEVVRRTVEHTYKLRVKTEPEKKTYTLNEELEIDDLVIVLVRDDIEETILKREEYSMRISLNGITKTSLDEVGVYQLIFSIQYFSTTYTTYWTFEVVNTVTNPPQDKLVIDESKSKLEWWTNETFDPNQILVYITNQQETNKVPIDSLQCSFTILFNNIEVDKFTTEGVYFIKIDYLTLSTTIRINVSYRKITKRLVLNIENARTTFYVGEAFSTYGLAIDYYEDDVLKVRPYPQYCKITLYLNNIEKESLDEPGTYSVVIEYEGAMEGYKIAVI